MEEDIWSGFDQPQEYWEDSYVDPQEAAPETAVTTNNGTEEVPAEEQQQAQLRPDQMDPTEGQGPGGNRVERGPGALGNSADGSVTGVEKFMEENVGIPAADLVNNIGSFLGLTEDKTPEEIAKERQQSRADAAADMTEMRESKDFAGEVLRTPLGAAAGAAETTLEAAEVLGDTIKSIPSLLQLTEGDQTQNPFNQSEYEWTKWRLGQDEIGAKTAVGQLAQGIGEFALMAGPMGAFKGVKGAGAAFKAAKGLGKAKVVATTALKEGAYGMAADFVQGLGSGDDNMSNLIRRYKPEWLPQWTHILAVNDVDGPYMVGLKNMFDGFGLGSLVGGLGVPVAAKFSVDKLPKGATEAQKIEAAQEAVVDYGMKELERVTTFDIPAPLKSVFNRTKDIGDQAHFDRMKPIMDQASNGIPVLWDDMANVFVDHFTPGNRQLLNDFNGSIYRAFEEVKNGAEFTRNPFTGAKPTEGFAVAIDGETLTDLTPASVQAFIQKNADVLSREDVFIGAWKDPKTGMPQIELSRVVPDRGAAELLGTAFDQKGVFDIQNERFIPTWGKDELKSTKNGHLKSPLQTPSNANPIKEVDTPKAMTEAAAGAIMDRTAPPGVKTGTRKPLTKSAIHKIKKGMGGDPKAKNKKWFDSLVNKYRVEVNNLAEYLKRSPKQVAVESQKAFAELQGLDYEMMDFSKLKTKFGDQEILTDTGIVTTNALIKDLSSQLHPLVSAVGDLGKEGLEISEHATQMLDTLGALMRLHHDTSSIAGRMLYNHQIDIFGKKFQWNHKPPGMDQRSFDQGMEKLDELRNALQDGSPAARVKAQKLAAQLAMAEGNPAKMQGVWRALWVEGENIAFRSFYNSLLSGAETHIVNAISSGVNAWLRPAAAALGSGDMRLLTAATYNFQRNLGEAWDQAMIAWRTGEAVSDNVKKLQASTTAEETTQQLKILGELADASGDTSLSMGVKFMKFMQMLVDNKVVSFPSRLMTTTDEFMKAWVARIEFQSRHMKDAIDKAADSADSAFDIFQNTFDAAKDIKIDSKTGQILDDDLLFAAREANYQQALKGTAAEMGRALQGNRFTRIFFPFVKTGHNITVFGLQHSPLARFTGEWQEVMSGTDEYAKAVMRGRERIGYGIVGMAGMMYLSGNLTGPADPNATARELEERPPYSMRVPGTNKWISYDRMAPFDFVVRQVATVGEAFHKGELAEDKATYMLNYLAWGLAANLGDRSVTAGIKPMGMLLNPRGVTGDRMMAEIANIANGFIPGSTARRQVNSIFRPYKQDWDSQMARFLDQVSFGLINDGYDRRVRDMWDGSLVKSPNGGWNATVNPGNISESDMTPGKQWLLDIQYDRSLVAKTLGGVKLRDYQIQAINRKMGELGFGKAMDDFYAKNKEWLEEERRDYIAAQRGQEATKAQAKTGTKEQQDFFYNTNEIVMKYRDMAIQALKNDPEFAEIGMQIEQQQLTAQNNRRSGTGSQIKELLRLK